MCGQIKRSNDAAEAVNFALAYARHDQEGSLDPKETRRQALYFIGEYTPAAHRNEARELLAKRTDAELTTTLYYWTDVVS